jgi:guanylate kinase
MQQKKLIVFTAPSGAGKTTIVKHLLQKFDFLGFSISATTREKRDHETNGLDYYFLSLAQFREKLEQKEFVEWEEVYDNQYYGTLKSEVERVWSTGKHILFDIDVKGAVSIKAAYPDQTLVVFVKPPSPEILFERLRNRKTETSESLRKRMARAARELTYEDRFDKTLVNDVLETTLSDAERIIQDFISK